MYITYQLFDTDKKIPGLRESFFNFSLGQLRSILMNRYNEYFIFKNDYGIFCSVFNLSAHIITPLITSNDDSFYRKIAKITLNTIASSSLAMMATNLAGLPYSFEDTYDITKNLVCIELAPVGILYTAGIIRMLGNSVFSRHA